MKIIEGLKKIKELQKKAEDLRDKIKHHSAYLSTETAVYENQKRQVQDWLQAHSDVLKEVLNLRITIQKTNINTMVTINLNGKGVEKSIAEWIHRRRDLANDERNAWKGLTDRGLRETSHKESTGELKEIKIVRCYDPKTRDEKVEIYDNEPSTIDSKLEVVNAVTELQT